MYENRQTLGGITSSEVGVRQLSRKFNRRSGNSPALSIQIDRALKGKRGKKSTKHGSHGRRSLARRAFFVLQGSVVAGQPDVNQDRHPGSRPRSMAIASSSRHLVRLRWAGIPAASLESPAGHLAQRQPALRSRAQRESSGFQGRSYCRETKNSPITPIDRQPTTHARHYGMAELISGIGVLPVPRPKGR